MSTLLTQIKKEWRRQVNEKIKTKVDSVKAPIQPLYSSPAPKVAASPTQTVQQQKEVENKTAAQSESETLSPVEKLEAFFKEKYSKN